MPRPINALEYLCARLHTSKLNALRADSRCRRDRTRTCREAIRGVVRSTNTIFRIRRLRKFVIRTDTNATSFGASVPDDIPVAGVSELAFTRGVVCPARITARDRFRRKRRIAPRPRRRQRDRGGWIIAARNLWKLPAILARVVVPHEVFRAKLEFEIRSATEAHVQCVEVGRDEFRSILVLKSNLTFPRAGETIDRCRANPIPVGHARVLAEELDRELLRV